jgi:transcriptional regulator with XRE-family HTH domain
MGFKENLKAELTYADMHVKELAALSGIKKQTIDSYLRENNYTPSVVAAVKIAKALGVSVEQLVTGKETTNKETPPSLLPELGLFMKSIEQLSREDRKIIIDNAINLIKALQNRKKRV